MSKNVKKDPDLFPCTNQKYLLASLTVKLSSVLKTGIFSHYWLPSYASEI